MRAHLLIPAICLLGACTADPVLPPLTQPGQWRYIADDDSLTTSRCIGSPATPLCATETLLACFQRGRMDLCRLVDDGTGIYAEAFSSPAPGGRYLAYRIVAAKRLGYGEELPDAPGARPGDVVLMVDQRDGVIGQDAPATGAPVQRFILRHQADGRWKAIQWGGPGD